MNNSEYSGHKEFFPQPRNSPANKKVFHVFYCKVCLKDDKFLFLEIFSIFLLLLFLKFADNLYSHLVYWAWIFFSQFVMIHAVMFCYVLCLFRIRTGCLRKLQANNLACKNHYWIHFCEISEHNSKNRFLFAFQNWVKQLLFWA